MFREWSHQFGEFPEIIGVMGIREIRFAPFPNHHANNFPFAISVMPVILLSGHLVLAYICHEIPA
jgi:hypothetical protein